MQGTWFPSLATDNIPLTVEQLSLCATATEPAYFRACVLQKQKPPQWEVWAMQRESSPCLPQLEKSPCSNEDAAEPQKKRLQRDLAF